MTAKPQCVVPPRNPFREAYRQRLQRLGSKYRPAQIDDSCERRLLAEERGVSLARDARLLNFNNINPF